MLLVQIWQTCYRHGAVLHENFPREMAQAQRVSRKQWPQLRADVAVFLNWQGSKVNSRVPVGEVWSMVSKLDEWEMCQQTVRACVSSVRLRLRD